MTVDDFEKIARQVQPLARQAYLHVLGEPLLHPNFEEIILTAESLRLPIEIVTNGANLNGRNVVALLHPIVRQVDFSLQALVENLTPAQLEQSLLSIWRFTEQAAAARPDLYINYRLWNLASLAQGLSTAPDVALLASLQRISKLELPPTNMSIRRKGIKLRERLYLHLDKRFVWPNISKDAEPINSGYCHALENQFAILSDGTVVPCCLDYQGQLPLGNCLSQSLESILNSDRAVAIRQGFANGKRIEALCRQCRYIDRFPLPQNPPAPGIQ